MKRDQYQMPEISLATYDLIHRAIGVAPHERDVLLFEALNDVFKEFSHTDPDYIEALSNLEMDGKISKDDKLLLFVLHVTARDAGPYDLKKLHDSILDEAVSGLSIEEVDRLFMHPKIKIFIKDITVRLKQSI